MKRFKKRVFEIIEDAGPNDKASSYFDIFINLLILVSVLALYLETFSGVSSKYDNEFLYVYFAINAIFSIEYFLRIWTADLLYPQKTKFNARITYIKSFYGLVDLIALIPFWSPLNLGLNTGVFRIFRLGRLLQLKRFARFRESLSLFSRVISKKKDELQVTVGLVVGLMLIMALLMYYAENPAQPEVFRNVYDSLWWAVITLTTVGYGDMYPITPWGRFLGGIIAFLGIGLIALPTGILSGSLMDEFDKKKPEKSVKCPRCGKKIK